MHQEESIYNLLPRERIVQQKNPIYKSLYPYNIAPTASTFCLKTSSYPNVANINGEFNYPRGAHPLKGSFATFGKPDAEKLRNSSELKKPSIPSLLDKPIMGLKSDKNYIISNAVDVILMQPRKKRFEDFDYLKKENYGKTPEYISKLKEDIEIEYKSIRDIQLRTKEEESKKRKNLSTEDIETLREGLKKKLQQLNHSYGQLTHRNNSEVYAAMRKEGLEKEIQMIEKDLEKLNSNNVIIDLNR